jgi:hypothetical protein
MEDEIQHRPAKCPGDQPSESFWCAVWRIVKACRLDAPVFPEDAAAAAVNNLKHLDWLAALADQRAVLDQQVRGEWAARRAKPATEEQVEHIRPEAGATLDVYQAIDDALDASRSGPMSATTARHGTRPLRTSRWRPGGEWSPIEHSLGDRDRELREAANESPDNARRSAATPRRRRPQGYRRHRRRL